MISISNFWEYIQSELENMWSWTYEFTAILMLCSWTYGIDLIQKVKKSPDDLNLLMVWDYSFLGYSSNDCKTSINSCKKTSLSVDYKAFLSLKTNTMHITWFYDWLVNDCCMSANWVDIGRPKLPLSRDLPALGQSETPKNLFLFNVTVKPYRLYRYLILIWFELYKVIDVK